MNVIKAQSLEMADLFATFSAGQRGVKEGTTRLRSHLENGPPCCHPTASLPRIVFWGRILLTYSSIMCRVGNNHCPLVIALE